MDQILLMKITETPRDAMQGWSARIPAEKKARYINALLKVGFDTVDCGSFVSAKAVPQMADTPEVLKLLDVKHTNSNLMVIVGNVRGGHMASPETRVKTIAYPYSVSATFLKRNLNTTPGNAWRTMFELKDICDKSGKEFRVYITMAFGNPYDEASNNKIVLNDVEKLYQGGIHDLVISDTTGEGTPESIQLLCSDLISSFPGEQMGIHLHTKPNDWQEKIDAAWSAGVRRFESALGGYGGCPMTGYELLANLNTLDLAGWCRRMQIPSGIDEEALRKAQQIALEVFI